MSDFDFDFEDKPKPRQDDREPKRRFRLDDDDDRPRQRRDDRDDRHPRRYRQRRILAIAGIVAGVLVLAVIFYSARELSYPDLNTHFLPNGKGFAAPEITDGSICKGHGVVQNVNSSGILISLGDGGYVFMSWYRHTGALPKIGDRINFKCVAIGVTKPTTAANLPRSGSFEQARDNLQAAASASSATGNFDLISWSLR